MSTLTVQYKPGIEAAVDNISRLLTGSYPISKRSLAILLLAGDEEIGAMVSGQEPGVAAQVNQLISETENRHEDPLVYAISLQQREAADRLTQDLIRCPDPIQHGWGERLSRAMINPVSGLPILVAVLLVLYLIVGVIGAQILVDWLENVVFAKGINPWIQLVVEELVPWPVVRDLIVGEYGILTLGVRYAVAIILPIIGTFFLVFAIIEDSGYLPRLALLIDRVFKRIGLNGRAVIPMVLGFGCDTMATVVTRTLETRRERLISTMLLALAIPCSAQLGVIFAILAGRPAALVVWAGVTFGIFLLVGFLAARLMPGEQPHFYMELPPLRLPRLSNVLVKTYTRMEWYFKEVFPLFILASILIWIGQVTGLFELAIVALAPLVRSLGLPEETVVAFMFGFFRRDYGAAGLYDLKDIMTGIQLTVAAVTLTLFVPCIAQFSVMLKERGWKAAFAVFVFIFPFAFFVGWVLNYVLIVLRVKL